MQIENEKVRELVRALDLEDSAVRADYSGRAMYGQTCFGIVIEGDLLTVGVALAEVFGADDAWDIARAGTTDSMGYSTIVYFPGWELEDANEFAEEYEDA